jgi:hypothetical protein
LRGSFSIFILADPAPVFFVAGQRGKGEEGDGDIVGPLSFALDLQQKGGRVKNRQMVALPLSPRRCLGLLSSWLRPRGAFLLNSLAVVLFISNAEITLGQSANLNRERR